MQADVKIDANAALGDLSKLIAAAAGGDLPALRSGRELARASRQEAVRQENFLMAQGHALEAMFWARFTASRGHAEDVFALAGVLSELAEYWGFDNKDPGAWYGNTLLAEAAAMFDRLASAGHEGAAIRVNAMSSSVAPHIFRQATEIREMIDDSEE